MAVPLDPSSPGAVHETVIDELEGLESARLVTAAGAVVSDAALTAMELLNADIMPEEAKQILMLSAAEYCIAVYTITPEDMAALSAGVEVNVPEPAVPPHVCVASTDGRVIVVVVSEVTVLPNWS